MAHVAPPMLPSHPKDQDWNYFLRLIENYYKIVNGADDTKQSILLNALGHDGLGMYEMVMPTRKTHMLIVLLGAMNILKVNQVF